MIDVCDIQVMKPMLAAHGFHFSKAKGQNFLIAPWAVSYTHLTLPTNSRV